MSNGIAPEGTIYVCGACGKTSEDEFGMVGEHSRGWDESCMMNSVLCHVKEDGQELWVAVEKETTNDD